MLETNNYAYHNDHLATPQKMTDGTGVVVWSADYKPFGEATITVSTITNNLRFPGQYFDSETGLHYNYFRDYNPITGIYIEKDPIGLRGGINLYRYVANNPMCFLDLLGLDRLINLFPNGIFGPTITFVNDNPSGPSTNQPVSDATAAMIENAVIQLGKDININSTTGGTHDPYSRHSLGLGLDIDMVGEIPVYILNLDALQLQLILNQQSNIRENFGPIINTKKSGSLETPLLPPKVTLRPDQATMHQHHIHCSGQR